MYVRGYGRARSIYLRWSIDRHTVAVLPVNCFANSLLSLSGQVFRGKGKGSPVFKQKEFVGLLFIQHSLGMWTVIYGFLFIRLVHNLRTSFCLYEFPAPAIRSLLPTPLLGSLRFPNRTDSTHPDPVDPPTPTKNLLLWYSIKVSSVMFVFIVRLGQNLCALSMQIYSDAAVSHI